MEVSVGITLLTSRSADSLIAALVRHGYRVSSALEPSREPSQLLALHLSLAARAEDDEEEEESDDDLDYDDDEDESWEEPDEAERLKTFQAFFQDLLTEHQIKYHSYVIFPGHVPAIWGGGNIVIEQPKTVFDHISNETSE